MTLPRPVREHATVLLTKRTTQRQFLLKPCKETIQAWLYCLGLAAQDHGVELHATCVESNHHHTEVTDRLGTLPTFKRDLHSLMARVMNAKWKRQENLWSTEQTSVVELATAEDAFAKLIYAVTNPAKDHLVQHTRDWPGVTSVKAEYRQGEFTVRRPHWFFDKEGDTPKAVTLRFTRPPGFEDLTEEQWRNKVDAAVKQVEERAAREREENQRRKRKAGPKAKVRIGPTRVVGVKTLKRQSAFDKPNTPAPSRKLNPRIACRNRQLRDRLIAERKQWLANYRIALEAYRLGNKSVRFPQGTYQLRVDTHVRIAAVACLTAPYATRLTTA